MSRFANPNVPSIPLPTTDPASVHAALLAVKAGVESLAGQRGAATSRAVTFRDLIALGLITEVQAATVAGR